KFTPHRFSWEARPRGDAGYRAKAFAPRSALPQNKVHTAPLLWEARPRGEAVYRAKAFAPRSALPRSKVHTAPLFVGGAPSRRTLFTEVEAFGPPTNPGASHVCWKARLPIALALPPEQTKPQPQGRGFF